MIMENKTWGCTSNVWGAWSKCGVYVRLGVK